MDTRITMSGDDFGRLCITQRDALREAHRVLCLVNRNATMNDALANLVLTTIDMLSDELDPGSPEGSVKGG